MNVRQHDTGRPWMECLSPQMRQTIITSTCPPSLPTKRDMCLCVKQQISSLPCFQLCKNILYTYIYSWHQNVYIVHGICICMQRQRAIQVAYTYRGQKKQKVIGREILSLVARGKRSLHMCARPRLPLAPVDCVTCVHQGNLL